MVERNTSGFNHVDKPSRRPTVVVLFLLVFEVNFLMAPPHYTAGFIPDPRKRGSLSPI